MRLRVLIMFLLFGVSVFGQDLESQRRRIEQEISILDGQLRDNASRSASATSKLILIQTKVRSRKALLQQSDRQIALLDHQMTQKQREINRLQARLDTMTAAYEKLVIAAYRNRDARKWYMYIIASENLGQAFRRYSYLKNLSGEMNREALAIEEARDDLADQKDELALLRRDAKALRDRRAAEMKNLQDEEASAKKLSSQLAREKTKYQKELAVKKQQSAALEKQIREAIRKSESKSSKPIDYTLAGEFVANKGKLPWPVEGVVTGRFGKQYHPVFKSLQLPPNNGINIATAPDAVVSAVFDGVVVQISILPGYHQCVIVQHGNNYSLYSKVKTTFVKAGDKVVTGQRIGTVDTIAGETVFHFEIWDSATKPQNPELWLR